MGGVGVAFLLALTWSVVAIRLGPRLGIVDRPDDPSLKVHERPAVPLGGVGIFLALVVSSWISGNLDVGAVAAGGLLVAVGLIDDLTGLKPLVRLGGEAAAGWMLAALANLPDVYRSPLGTIAVVTLVVVTVNAVNLLDGLDGLAGISATASALGIAALAMVRGVGANSITALLLVGSLLGFLVVNWPPARIFLGDNGAYLLGGYLVYAMLLASPVGSWDLAIALVVLGVFAVDMAATFVRRTIAGARLFSGDRSHLYDQLRDRGMSVRSVLVLAAATQVVFVAAALLLESSTSTVLRAGVLLGMTSAIFLALTVGGFLTPREP